jgi:hypothetical protein
MTGYHEYTVRGTGEFPIDMLRYDRSAPQNEADSARIHLSFHERLDGDRVIALTHPCLDHKRNCQWQPTFRRWESFLWRVTTINGEPVLVRRD